MSNNHYFYSNEQEKQLLEAEKRVIGVCIRHSVDGMLDESVIQRVQNILKPEDFYLQKHGTLFLALCSMANKRESISIVSLSGNLEKSGSLDKIGGPSYLMELAIEGQILTSVEHYAGIVKDFSIRRRFREACGEATQQAIKSDNIEDAVSNLQNEIQAIFNQIDPKGGFKSIGDTSPNAIENIQERSDRIKNGQAACDGISTGLLDLDRKIGGLGRGRQIILAARPSEGKTSLGLQIAAHAARSGNHVCVFSLEMSGREITERILSNIAEIDVRQALDPSKSTRLLHADKLLKDIELYIDDSPLPIEKIEARVRRQALIKPIDLIVLDYLQLVETKKAENRCSAITEISRRLKLLPKELNCPVLTLSQLNRQSEKDKRAPFLSDLRDSGSIEQDADQVIFIHTPSGKDKGESGPREIIIAKNRHGPIGQIDLYFRKDLTRFEPLSDRAEGIF